MAKLEIGKTYLVRSHAGSEEINCGRVRKASPSGKYVLCEGGDWMAWLDVETAVVLEEFPNVCKPTDPVLTPEFAQQQMQQPPEGGEANATKPEAPAADEVKAASDAPVQEPAPAAEAN